MHKITAGDGYTYLTRQVAAMDSTERGYDSLNDYYSAKGETPGRWWGKGLQALDVAAGSAVTEAQMKALFGEGRHPNADAIEATLISEGMSERAALSMTRLGSPYRIFEGTSEWRRRLAIGYADYNAEHQAAKDAPIPAQDRARIRTEIAAWYFGDTYGRDPIDERELNGFIAQQSRPSTTAVAGFDLTFSPVKSVSTLWATAPAPIREELAAAHAAAVDHALTWVQNNIAYTRLGDGGPAQVDTTGLMVARFDHRDSRNGDPQLHTHCAVSSKVQLRNASDPIDGWRALDGRLVYELKVSAGEEYNTALEQQIVDRLGGEFVEHASHSGRRGIRDLAGVDHQLNTEFSSRRAEIVAATALLAEKFVAEHHRQPTPLELIDLAQQANLETRQAKHDPQSAADQHALWAWRAGQVLNLPAEQVGEHLVAAAGLSLTPAPAPSVEVTDGLVDQLTERTMTAVAGTRSVWKRHHVYAEAHRQARPLQLDQLARGQLISTVTDRALDRGSVPIGAPIEDPRGVPAPLLRASDRQSVFTRIGGQLYTSQALLDAIERIITAAGQHTDHQVNEQHVSLAMLEWQANNAGRQLNTGQQRLITEVATSTRQVQLVRAPAGTGKTTAMGVLAAAITNAGGNIVALSPQASAAQQLSRSLGGAQTDTVDKFVYELRHRHPLDRAPWVRAVNDKTLLVIDEAGLASTSLLDETIAYVTDRGGRVLLVGDDRQLAPTGAGGVLRDLDAAYGSLTLDEVMRFTDKTEGAASLALRAGNPSALGYYLDHHRIHATTRLTAVEQVYTRAQAELATGADVLTIAPSLELVAELNTRFRAARLEAAGGPVGPEATVSGGETVSAGDTIITKRNDRRLPLGLSNYVKNNDRFTVLQVHRDGALVVRSVHNRSTVRLPADYVARHVRLGYAATLRSEQGDTVGGQPSQTGPRAGITHTLLDDTCGRAELYLGMTRGTSENHAWILTAGDGDPHNVIRPDILAPATAVEAMHAMLARDTTARSARSEHLDATDPARLLTHAAASYRHAVNVAAEHLTGPDQLAALSTAAEQAVPGVTTAAAWDALRAHLAMLALTGNDPIRQLSTAAGSRTLEGATDIAAVLDWRLDPTGNHSQPPGPLPWLPQLPEQLATDPTFGDYLTRCAATVTHLADHVAAAARAWTTEQAPAWATPYLSAPDLVAQLATWRAATSADPADLRPAGQPQTRLAMRGHRHRLITHALTISGIAHSDAAHRWHDLITALDPRIPDDETWPILAGRLNTADTLGIDVPGLLRDAAQAGPLPVEAPADALWWRLAAVLSPTGTDQHAGSSHARPPWTSHLHTILGPSVTDRITRDRLWPAVVSSLDHAARTGHDPDRLALAAAGMLAGHLSDLKPAELATGLLWHLNLLTRNPEPDHDEALPPDPASADLTPPADAHPVLAELAARDTPLQLPLDFTFDTGPSRTAPPATPAPKTADPTQLRALAAAHEFYQSRAADSWVPGYLTGRGLAGLQAGYAPAGWTNLVDHLRRLDIADQAMLDSGLAKISSRNSLIDTFRDRLMLPIYHPAGHIVTFSGRAHPDRIDDRNPRYLNGPTTDLYRKGELPHGLDPNTIAALQAGADLVIVEGPLDAAAINHTASRHGLHLVAVYSGGTALSREHLATLDAIAPLAARTVIAGYDNDSAGQAAALKMYRLLDTHYPEVTAAMLDLPAGADPAQLLQTHGDQHLADALAATRPLLDLVVDDCLARFQPFHPPASDLEHRLQTSQVLWRTVETALFAGGQLRPGPELARQAQRIADALDRPLVDVVDALGYTAFPTEWLGTTEPTFDGAFWLVMVEAIGDAAFVPYLDQPSERDPETSAPGEHQPTDTWPASAPPETAADQVPDPDQALDTSQDSIDASGAVVLVPDAGHLVIDVDPSDSEQVAGDLSNQLQAARIAYDTALAAYNAGAAPAHLAAADLINDLTARAAAIAPYLDAITSVEQHNDSVAARTAADQLADALQGQPLTTQADVDTARAAADQLAAHDLATHRSRLQQLEAAIDHLTTQHAMTDTTEDRRSADTDPAQRWAALANTITDNLTSTPAWNRLAANIERAHQLGYNVTDRLPQLAAAEPLPAHAAAAELNDRLVEDFPQVLDLYVPQSESGTHEPDNEEAASQLQLGPDRRNPGLER